MRIEKIELIGFKSFAEKTTFTLHPGITCIVGPNGSGKSNIVDSFRWVLGEQSAKSLRGEKMEEVIFNGSAAKKPRGMSEVNLSLLFDSPEQGNGDSRTLTSISRRLYRSGESEYLINRSQCRLKDIRDLFLDTGLEIKSYSILEQGRINEILNSKPQERRFLIEEVAGVMKYKVRRAEALSKLESSRLNLQRINDIVVEVRRQINSLDRQVKKAERYKRLSAEMRVIELKLGKREFAALRESLDRILLDLGAAREQDALVRADLTAAENKGETRRIALLEKEKALEALSAELQGIEREIAEKERTAAVALAESGHLRESLARLSQQETEIAQRIAETETRRGDLASAASGLDGEIERLREEIAERSESIRDLECALSDNESLVEAKRRELFRNAEEVSHLRNEIGRLATSVENLEKKGASSLRESDSARDQLAAAEDRLRDTEGAIIGKNNDLLLLNEKKGMFAADIGAEKTTLADSRANIAKGREELASVSSRLDSLREIVHEEFSKEILTEAERLHILASIAETIDVDEIYERAIESALAEKVNGFILSSFEDIANAAALVKQRGLGRTAFIPRDITSPAVEAGEPPVSSEFLVGRASDLVRVAEGGESFSPVVISLLRNVFVVRDLSSAFTLHASGNRFTLVTLDGEIVEGSGAVVLGEGKGILKRKREIRELESLTSRKREEIETFEAVQARAEAALREKEESLRGIDSAIIATEKEVSLLRLTADTQRGEREKIERKLSYLHIEQDEVSREKESLGDVMEEKERGMVLLQAKQTEVEQAIAEMQEAISLTKGRCEEGRASITELRLSLNSCRERLEATRKEEERSLKTLEDLSGAGARIDREKADIESRVVRSGEEIARTEEELKLIVVNADRLRAVISGEREIIRSEAEELTKIDHEVKALRGTIDSLASRIAEIEVSAAEHRIKLETISEGIRQNYGIEIDSLEAEPVEPEDEERLAEIREKIREMGPVNLGTLEEYEELTTRFEFLTKQQDDLNKSIAELEEAITRINSTTRKKLREAFEQLSVRFAEVFVYLFGGGKAELVLTDENNILETGIDIIAQPPGKKLQNINLLSGGEKALTALSLLFASFLIKPSPLCVLDEVDAPLDEANVGRFGRMLRDLSKSIQFIVVTHNRVTMEAADYIYGITMEEPGVSKVISMQLADAVSA